MVENDALWFQEDSSPVKSAALISDEIFNGASRCPSFAFKASSFVKTREDRPAGKQASDTRTI
jgi:hypothetical protein